MDPLPQEIGKRAVIPAAQLFGADSLLLGRREAVNGPFRARQLLDERQDLVLRRVERGDRQVPVDGPLGMLQHTCDGFSDVRQVGRLEGLVPGVVDGGCIGRLVEADRSVAQALIRNQ